MGVILARISSFFSSWMDRHGALCSIICHVVSLAYIFIFQKKIVVSNCKVDRCCIGFGETAHYKWCLTENSIHYGTPNEWRQMKMFPKCFWAADTRGRGETLLSTNSNTSNNNVFLSDELKTGPSQCLSYLGCPTGGTVRWAQVSKLLIRQK